MLEGIKELTLSSHCHQNEKFKLLKRWYYIRRHRKVKYFVVTYETNGWPETFIQYAEYKEVIWMAKDVEVRKIVSNLSKLGIQAKITKSRVELLKALALPQTPQIQ